MVAQEIPARGGDEPSGLAVVRITASLWDWTKSSENWIPQQCGIKWEGMWHGRESKNHRVRKPRWACKVWEHVRSSCCSYISWGILEFFLSTQRECLPPLLVLVEECHNLTILTFFETKLLGGACVLSWQTCVLESWCGSAASILLSCVVGSVLVPAGMSR